MLLYIDLLKNFWKRAPVKSTKYNYNDVQEIRKFVNTTEGQVGCGENTIFVHRIINVPVLLKLGRLTSLNRACISFHTCAIIVRIRKESNNTTSIQFKILSLNISHDDCSSYRDRISFLIVHLRCINRKDDKINSQALQLQRCQIFGLDASVNYADYIHQVHVARSALALAKP